MREREREEERKGPERVSLLRAPQSNPELQGSANPPKDIARTQRQQKRGILSFDHLHPTAKRCGSPATVFRTGSEWMLGRSLPKSSVARLSAEFSAGGHSRPALRGNDRRLQRQKLRAFSRAERQYFLLCVLNAWRNIVPPVPKHRRASAQVTRGADTGRGGEENG